MFTILENSFFSPFEDLFESNFNNMNSGTFNADIIENEKGYLVQAELPGVKKEDINIEYRDNNLIITAKRDEILNNNGNNAIRKERYYGEMARSFYIGNVDKNLIRANFENGVLQIAIPKAQSFQSYNSIPIE